MIKKIFVCFIFIGSLLFFSCKDGAMAEKLYLKANEFYVQQNFAAATECIDKALKEDSGFYQAQLLKSKICYFSDDYDSAEKLLNKLVKKYPQYSEARIWKIRNCMAQKKYDYCEKLLKEELSFNQTDWRIYYLYSILANKQEQVDKRLAMCRKALEVLEDSEKVYIEMSDLWILLGMRSHAIDALDKAEVISSSPDDIRLLKKYLKEGGDIK